MELKYHILLCLLLSAVLFSGCAQQEAGSGIGQMPEAELRQLCEGEDWPLSCSVIPDTEGRELCERCKELIGEEDSLQKMCEGQDWPPEGCSVIADPEGRSLCEACKGLAGEETGENESMPADLTQLTLLDDLAGDPSWSPDGSRIVFLGMEKNTVEGGLYVMNSDGTGITKIAGQWGRNHLFNPSWSPVSNKIVGHGMENNGLFLIDLDGDPAERVQLADEGVEHASWSPDGKRIAYNVYSGSHSSLGYEYSSIWVMNSDGSGKTRLTSEEEGFCTGPSFSYDGSKIVYLKGFTTTLPGAKPEEAVNEIWVMDSDGSNKHMIYAPGDGMQLIRERAWNKNNKIIFARHQYQRAPKIWVINADGTSPQCILDPEAEGMPTAIYDDPVWNNNGTRVAVTKVILSDESWQIAAFSWKE